MRFYCPKCFSDFSEDKNICPSCGLDIHAFYDPKDYIDKLILALKHPEPSTPVRAAWLLGKIGEERAVDMLIECFRDSDDIYLLAAVANALGEIGGETAFSFLETQRDHPAFMVRKEVRNSLKKQTSLIRRGGSSEI